MHIGQASRRLPHQFGVRGLVCQLQQIRSFIRAENRSQNFIFHRNTTMTPPDIVTNTAVGISMWSGVFHQGERLEINTSMITDVSLSVNAGTAINDRRRAGDPRGFIRCQKQCQVRNIFRSAKAAKWMTLDIDLTRLLGVGVALVGCS